MLGEDVAAILIFVDSMRTFHNKFALDPDCTRNFYSANDQARNNGWLMLVSKKFFGFGRRRLMTEIRACVEEL